MQRRERMVKVARWLVVWAVLAVVMRFVTGLTDIYRGWLATAVASAPVVASWYLVPWLRSRRERKAAAQ
ncbi:hypothetical protein [Streptomyces sp. NPDC056190]|uniref:hypothetical protein n=1 Tax=unclassified Streptomyces TaxID=2593676 RepID=UPI0035D54DF4